jgi:hypothetical protein
MLNTIVSFGTYDYNNYKQSHSELPKEQQHSTPSKGRTEHNRLKHITRQDEHTVYNYNTFTDQPPKQPTREIRHVTK